MSNTQAQLVPDIDGVQTGTGLMDTSCAGGLRIDKLRAIPLLLSGKTAREVGEAIGRTRETVAEWCTTDDDFMAEYERQKMLLYNAELLKARSRLSSHLDADDWKPQQGAAKILLEHHAQMARAHSTSTVTVILDKLQAALQGQGADTIDAEYAELAAQPALPAVDTDPIPDADCSETQAEG